MLRSMTDVAFEILGRHEGEISFIDFWNQVSQEMGYTPAQAENKIARFYTEIMLDKRFVSLNKNMWDLRARHKLEEVLIPLENIVIEDDDENDELLDFDEEDDEARESDNDEGY